MKILFCDASFDPHHTAIAEGDCVRGKIAVSDAGEINRVEKIVVGKVPNLKQYINVFELTALARAIEIACSLELEHRSLQIFTDSKVAMIWACNGKVNPRVVTAAHTSALDYLRRMKIQFDGVVTFHHVRREYNPAGHLLETELKRESPHAV